MTTEKDLKVVFPPNYLILVAVYRGRGENIEDFRLHKEAIITTKVGCLKYNLLLKFSEPHIFLNRSRDGFIPVNSLYKPHTKKIFNGMNLTKPPQRTLLLA